MQLLGAWDFSEEPEAALSGQGPQPPVWTELCTLQRPKGPSCRVAWGCLFTRDTQGHGGVQGYWRS